MCRVALTPIPEHGAEQQLLLQAVTNLCVLPC